MDRYLVQGLLKKYASEGLDFFKAVRVWSEHKLSSADIKEQVKSDVNKDISASSAEELYHLGCSMKHDYDAAVKEYEVSKGRSDLTPPNYKKKHKLSPAIKQSMDHLGQNLYRHKSAKTYWTLKEKVGEDGTKSIYFVAVDDTSIVKTADPSEAYDK